MRWHPNDGRGNRASMWSVERIVSPARVAIILIGLLAACGNRVDDSSDAANPQREPPGVGEL